MNFMCRNIILLPALLLVALFVTSCTCNQEKKDKNPDTDTIIKVSINRYEMVLFGLDKSKLKDELKRIQPDYAVFLDGDLNDSMNVKQLFDYLNDPLMQDNYKACLAQYADLKQIENDLSQMMTYYKHYFPEARIPMVYTYVSGMSFEQPVIFGDSILIIALDMYLGENYSLYNAYGLPQFHQKYMNRDYIVRDCAMAMAEYYCYNDMKGANCLDYMLYNGKKLCFADALLPETPDSVKIRYSTAQLAWCYDNEAKMWAYFVDNKILYNTDQHLIMKFFSIGPFTTAFTRESPPRTGSWMGWRIAREYLKNNSSVDIAHFIKENDSQKILSLSKYKPKKP
jgi:hypothetical protein